EGIEKLKATGAYGRIEHRWLATATDEPDYLRYAAIVTGALVLVVVLAAAWTWSLRRTVARRTAQLKEQLERRDQSEREQARLQQQRDELLEGYRRLTDDSPDAIFVNADGHIVYANAAALRLVGAESPGQLLGAAILDRVHRDDREAAIERL